jgi:hypothetical protein
MPQKSDPPKPDKRDYGLAAIKATLSALPTLGGPAVELLNIVITPSIERRRNVWLQNIAERLSDLENRIPGLINSAAENPVFVDTLLQASQAALRTRDDAKREALRNAVLNSILPDAPEADLQDLFIGFIDAFSTWHIALLSFLSKNPAEESAGAYVSTAINRPLCLLIEERFLELHNKANIYRHFITDLKARGLFDSPQRAGDPIDVTWGNITITPLGQAFLSFIADPLAAPPDKP